MGPKNRNIGIINRIFYKAMKSLHPAVAYPEKVKGRTTLMETNFNANVFVPRLDKWDEVTLPGKWDIEDAQPTVNEVRDEIETVAQHLDGKVEVNFGSRKSAERSKISLDKISMSN